MKNNLKKQNKKIYMVVGMYETNTQGEKEYQEKVKEFKVIKEDKERYVMKIENELYRLIMKKELKTIYEFSLENELVFYTCCIKKDLNMIKNAIKDIVELNQRKEGKV